MTRSSAARRAAAEAAAAEAPRDEAPPAEAASTHVHALATCTRAEAVASSLRDIVRQTGWFLVRRTQLLRDGRPRRDCVPLLRPLADACRSYLQHASALREQLLCAVVHLEHALERAHGAGDVAALSEPTLALDPMLYRVLSSMPIEWDGSAAPAPATDVGALDTLASDKSTAVHEPPKMPGSSAASPITIDSNDDDVPARTRASEEPSEQAAKRRKTDTETPVALPSASDTVATAANSDLVSLLGSIADKSKESVSDDPAPPAPDMLDFSWLDLDNLGQALGNGDALGSAALDSPSAMGTSSLFTFDVPIDTTSEKE